MKLYHKVGQYDRGSKRYLPTLCDCAFQLEIMATQSAEFGGTSALHLLLSGSLEKATVGVVLRYWPALLGSSPQANPGNVPAVIFVNK